MTERSIARTAHLRALVEEWERDDVERRRGPRPLPALLLAVLASLGCACAIEPPVAPVEHQEDQAAACLEIVDAHCQRVAECRGNPSLYDLCVEGVDQFCPAWSPEPTCVEDIWTAECVVEMPLPCSCGSGTPNCP